VLSRVRRLHRYLETHGLRQTLSAIGRLLRGRIYADARLIVIVKELDSIVEPWHAGDLRFADLNAERMPDLAGLNRRRGRPDVQQLFVRYFDHGFHAFLAYRGEELVGYYWWIDRDVPAAHTDLHKLGLDIELSEDDAYGSHFFLLEEHRGGGLAADFLFYVESSLRERGFSRIWGYVDSANRPARWVYSTRGYKPMWIVRLRRIVLIERATRESL
jgi:GNAT superfamily N-acetyltransferase